MVNKLRINAKRKLHHQLTKQRTFLFKWKFKSLSIVITRYNFEIVFKTCISPGDWVWFFHDQFKKLKLSFFLKNENLDPSECATPLFGPRIYRRYANKNQFIYLNHENLTWQKQTPPTRLTRHLLNNFCITYVRQNIILDCI